MTMPRTIAAFLRRPLGQVGAIAGLLAAAVLMATAASFAFTAAVEHAIPARAPLTTAPTEGVTP